MNSINLKKIKISLILNIIILIFTILATIMMFTGFKFISLAEPVLETTKFGLFKFFTVDSNLFMGFMSLIFIILEIKILKGKLNNIARKYYLLKLMSTTAVSLTFLVVFLYLGPISSGGIISMIINSNLFFHLLIPVLSIISFIFFENNNEIKYKDVFYGMFPTFIYGVFYLINILIHIENGKVSPLYDFYYFVQNGLWTSFIVFPLILIINYLIALLLCYFNKKII